MACGHDPGVCNCIFTAGAGVGISGAGSTSDPYIISIARQYLEGGNTDTGEVIVTGAGDVNDPFIVRVQLDITVPDGIWQEWRGAWVDFDAIETTDDNTLYVVMP